MKQLIAIISLVLAAISTHAKLNVVATLPDFGIIAESVGGEHVHVTTIARGTEDPHFVDARPSFVRVLNQADVLVETGADLEVGWLPPLVQAARNSKIAGNAPGRLVLGRHLALIDVPKGPVDRSMGDVHPGGNPHFWLDPANGKVIASQLARVFAELDAAHAGDYAANAQRFSEKLNLRIAEWEKRMQPLNGTKVLTYHKTFDYFARRFGLEVVGQLEPRPGLEPTASHMNSLAQQAKQAGVKLILIEPFRRRSTPQHLANSIGAKVVVFPDKTGATPAAKDYFALFDEQIALLTSALNAPK